MMLFNWIELLTHERVEWIVRQEFIWRNGKVMKDAAGQPVLSPVMLSGIVVAEDDEYIGVATDTGMFVRKHRAEVHSLGFPACYHCEERFRSIEEPPYINGGGVAECAHGLCHVQCMFDSECESA